MLGLVLGLGTSVPLEHGALFVAVQQDARALHQMVSALGHGEDAAVVMAAVVSVDLVHRHDDAVLAGPELVGVVVVVVVVA
jgi:arginine exporter protein ArgO